MTETSRTFSGIFSRWFLDPVAQFQVLPSSQPTNQGQPLCLSEVLLLILQPGLGFTLSGCIGTYLGEARATPGFLVGNRSLHFKEAYLWSNLVWSACVIIFYFKSDSFPASLNKITQHKTLLHPKQDLGMEGRGWVIISIRCCLFTAICCLLTWSLVPGGANRTKSWEGEEICMH